MKFPRKICVRSLSLIILSSFLSAIVSSYFVGTALAVEQPTLQIYYSEALGTGEKVYHLTECEKEPAMGIVTCTKEDVGKNFGKQCDEKGEIGNVIYGCLKKIGEQGDYEKIPNTPYPAVNIPGEALTKAKGGCSDVAEDKKPLYGLLYGLVPEGPPTGGVWDENNMYGELVIPIVPAGIVRTTPVGHEKLPVYNSTLCASWDKVIGENGEALDDPTLTADQRDKIQKLREKLTDAGAAAELLATQDECTGTVHGSKLDKENMISCTILERVTGKSGTEILSKYMQMIYAWASGIVGIIAVLTMVYSGIQISMAGGDSAKIDSAKTRITQSIVGIVILFLSGLILYTINPTFFTG